MHIQIKKNLRKILLLIGILLAAAGIALFIILQSGAAGLKEIPEYGTPPEDEDGAYERFNREGTNYVYRDDLINILCLGIDGRETAVKCDVYGAAPRADAIYLLTLDPKQKTVSFLSISRDTMTDIQIIDGLGQDAGLHTSHLALQYTFGDGLEESGQLMTEAVSRLLNGIPIHAYCALYWNAISPLTDAVGPIEVYVPEYMTVVNPPVFHESGYQALDGRQAVEYVRERDINEFGTNEVRSGWQQEFMQALYQATKQKVIEDPQMIQELLNILQDYLVTDLNTKEIMKLATWATQWDISDLEFTSLPGECVEGDLHDEFWVDEEAKRQLMRERFYRSE